VYETNDAGGKVENKMNILLTAINAKYIHSNLAVYSLRTYAKKFGHEVRIAEYTINHRVDFILEEIYRKKPDVLVFSCYIWNIEYVRELAMEFHKLCPQVPIWAGGPEVSFETEAFLRDNPAVTGLMMGEGEQTFSRLCSYYKGIEKLENIDGISYRDADGHIVVRPFHEPMPMDEIPFCYGDMTDFEHRIIYYESSRGCPFSCSYCLSSVDKRLRFRSLSLVCEELQFFLDHKVPQVKFVDRTFNCKHDHALGIWRYIMEHDNGITNFHFEISADLLNEEEISLISGMRPGLIQLEIGVQSTNPDTILEIHRNMQLAKVKQAVKRVQEGKNIHQHLDLIAGLPLEDYVTFQKSFDEIYALHPDQLQLGFLKVLKGSYMYEHAQEYGISYREKAPYEVLATNWLSYDEILNIRLVEEMLEVHYNSGQFLRSLSVLESCFDSAFSMFLEMGLFYRKQGYLNRSHSRVQRTEIFLEFARMVDATREQLYKEALMYDLYKIEKSKSRPKWAADLSKYRQQTSHYLREHGMEKTYCHLEPFFALDVKDASKERSNDGTPQWVLFDYEHRNPLTNEADMRMVGTLQSETGGEQV
jgi:radical SAM superfamily enzyme YgiQ (UPF0313 family)